jgi:hypothetical protein
MNKPSPFERLHFAFNEEGQLLSFDVAKRVETCVCCGKQLFAQCTGWNREDGSKVWMPVEIDLECKRGMKCYREYENSEYWRMPYVYWLPVHEHILQWVKGMVEIYFELRPIPLKWLEKEGQIRLFPRNGLKV